jgi:hypothetical protein
VTAITTSSSCCDDDRSSCSVNYRHCIFLVADRVLAVTLLDEVIGNTHAES